MDNKERRSVPTIFVAGYFGYGLVGDDAILGGMLADLRKELPTARFIVTSRDPELTRAQFLVEAIEFSDIQGVLKSIDEAQLVIVGGGGVFNEYAPYRPEMALTSQQDFNVLCASLPLLAAAANKPCMIYAVGVEPLYSAAAREQVRAAFELATVATVRDAGSLSILHEIGVDTSRVEVTADPAFRFEYKFAKAIKLPPEFLRVSPRLTVSLRHWTGPHVQIEIQVSKWEQSVAAALDQFLETHGGGILFTPHQRLKSYDQYSDDLPVIERIRTAMRLRDRTWLAEEPPSPEYIIAALEVSDLSLCMRYHSVILSIRSAVPCVAIAYSLKVRSALEQAGLKEYAIELEDVSQDQLFQALDRAYTQHQNIRASLAHISEELRHATQRNAQIARQLASRDFVQARPASRFVREDFFASQLLRLTHLLAERDALLASATAESQVILRTVRRFVENSEWDRAQPLLVALQSANPSRPEWSYLLAFCLHMQGQDQRAALSYYDKALASGYDEFWVRYNRGSLQRTLGNYDAACADLERAVELQPAFEPARNEFLLALAQKASRLIDDQQFEAGLQIVKRLLHIQPQHPEGNYLVAFCFHRLGKEPDKALQHYEIALAQGFDEFWVRYNRGALFWEMKALEAACDDLERAIALQPEHPGVRQLLAQLHAVASDSPTTVNQAQGIGAEAQAILRDLSLITIPDSLRTFSPTAPDNFEVELYNGIRLGLKPGRVMFELGTYCGALTVLAARIAGDARCVVLFEASPVSAARAQAMAAANGLQDIKVVNAFVSDRSGALQDFYLIDSGAGAAVQSADPAIASLFPQARKVAVPTLTLDEWIAGNGLRPDLIKIDIEGAEFLALKGMQNLLVTSGPDLILELHGDRMPGIGGTLKEMYALLSDAGYEFLDLHSGLAQSPTELLELYPIYGHIFCSKALADPASRERIVEVAGQLVAQQNALKRLTQLVFEARQLVDQHEFSRARVIVEELLASWGNHPEGNYLMAYVLHMLRQDPERALWHYAQALQLGFAEFWVRYNRASLLIALGRPLQAMPDLERAAALGIHQGASELLSQVRQSMARTPVSSDDTGPAALQHRARRFINKLRGRKV